MQAIMSVRKGVRAPAATSAAAEQRQATESVAVSSTPDMRETLAQIAAQVAQTRASETQGCCHCDVSSVRTTPSSSPLGAAASVRHRMRKRVRIETPPSMPAVDSASGSALLDAIRALHEQDRAELLGALRELTELVRSSHR